MVWDMALGRRGGARFTRRKSGTSHDYKRETLVRRIKSGQFNATLCDEFEKRLNVREDVQ